jgi:hypothetical protein
MKANAPDKLYVDVRDNLSDSILYGFTEKRTDDDIEYTRTDVFIEKALAFIRSCTTYDGLGYKAKCVNVENFRKYMEGE